MVLLVERIGHHWLVLAGHGHIGVAIVSIFALFLSLVAQVWPVLLLGLGVLVVRVLGRHGLIAS
jgi:hypothetical protein